MTLRTLFRDDVTRDIPPVVYFHEQTPERLAAEASQYIITGGWPPADPRHQRVPNGIHEQYVRLLTGITQALSRRGGVDLPASWISGFYGSGKSSFAKLLGLALDGVTLPDGPLEEYRAAIAGLPKSTEAERLVLQRVGQDIFRDRLMTYWQGRCPLTGITDPALLRASHIIAWKDCASDAERLNVHNGLLLSALWDAAFDRGLVTFDDDGLPQFSPKLSEAARAELRWHAPIPLTDKHRARLVWHRTEAFEVMAP